MEDLGQQRIDDLLASIASDTIAPAAGTSIGIAGAFGLAQLDMAAIHLDVDDPAPIRDQLDSDRRTMLELGARDARLVDKAFGSSGDITDEMYLQLAEIPITTAETALSGIHTGLELIDGRDEPAVPDAVCGLWLLRSVLAAAVMIARINVPYVPDDVDRDAMKERLDRLDTLAEESVEAIEDRTAAFG